MVVATEELSRGSLGVGGSLITRPEILARALVQGGTEAQKREWLPEARERRRHGGGRRDGARLRLGQRRDQDDRHPATATTTWSTASKTWCTFAGRADVLMLLARTDPDRDSPTAGCRCSSCPKPRCDGHELRVRRRPDGGRMEGRAIDTIGYRGMHSYEVELR